MQENLSLRASDKGDSNQQAQIETRSKIEIWFLAGLDMIHFQGFSYSSEIRTRGLLNLGKTFGPSKIGKN